jgi:hypothetical protein
MLRDSSFCFELLLDFMDGARIGTLECEFFDDFLTIAHAEVGQLQAIRVLTLVCHL